MTERISTGIQLWINCLITQADFTKQLIRRSPRKLSRYGIAQSRDIRLVKAEPMGCRRATNGTSLTFLRHSWLCRSPERPTMRGGLSSTSERRKPGRRTPPHITWRRSFASDLLETGVDVTTVSKMTGHVRVLRTAKYDRRGEDAKRGATKALHVRYPGRRRDLFAEWRSVSDGDALQGISSQGGEKTPETQTPQFLRTSHSLRHARFLPCVQEYPALPLW